MSQKPDPLLRKLDVLVEKLDVLTMMIASKPNSEQVNNLLKEKSQKEQIRILKEYNFPTEIIALMIGTTLGTARARISEIESEIKKEKK
jgi:ABC-type enterobactin transport system permease subunit